LLLPLSLSEATIHFTVNAGDTHTGVTIMQMDAGLDTGDMLLWQSSAISPDDTTALLHDRLADMGGALIVRALALAEHGELQATVQPQQGVTYAAKLDKSEAWIDWGQRAEVIVRRVHAFNPFPVAATHLGGEALKVWDAQVDARGADTRAVPGTILEVSADGVAVAALDSVVRLTALQRPGGRRLALADCLRGMDIAAGMQFSGATSGVASGPDAS